MTTTFNIIAGVILFAVPVWLAFSPRFAIKLYQLRLFKSFKISGEQRSMEGLRDFHEVENLPLFVPTLEGTMLHGWFYKGASSKVFIYNMGINSDLGKSLANARAMLAAGASVFAYEYRGFGSTAGKPSIKGICQDGLMAYDFVANELGYDASDIILYGESIGGGVASFVSDRRPAAALVLQSAFCSFEQLAKDKTPMFRAHPNSFFPRVFANGEVVARQHLPLIIMRGLLKMVLRTYPSFLFPPLLNNGERVARPHPPLTIIHGELDAYIPVNQAKLIYQAACQPKRLVLLPNTFHRLGTKAHQMPTRDWDMLVPALRQATGINSDGNQSTVQ